ncbi:MAG: hypothetical protein HQL53_11990, partial [Magnetococcales bacterium]|nr:hypothetical protein [Magnetococcales bacterium]
FNVFFNQDAISVAFNTGDSGYHTNANHNIIDILLNFFTLIPYILFYWWDSYLYAGIVFIVLLFGALIVSIRSKSLTTIVEENVRPLHTKTSFNTQRLILGLGILLLSVSPSVVPKAFIFVGYRQIIIPSALIAIFMAWSLMLIVAPLSRQTSQNASGSFLKKHMLKWVLIPLLFSLVAIVQHHINTSMFVYHNEYKIIYTSVAEKLKKNKDLKDILFVRRPSSDPIIDNNELFNNISSVKQVCYSNSKETQRCLLPFEYSIFSMIGNKSHDDIVLLMVASILKEADYGKPIRLWMTHDTQTLSTPLQTLLPPKIYDNRIELPIIRSDGRNIVVDHQLD